MFTNSIVIVTWASLNFNMFTHLNSRHMSSAGPFWDDSMGWFPTNLPSTAKVRNIRWVQQRRTSEVSPGPLSRILPDIAGGSFLRGCEKIMVLCGTYQNHQPFVQHLSDLAIDIQQVYQKPGGLLFGVCRFAYKLCSIHMLLWGWAISHLCPDSGLWTKKTELYHFRIFLQLYQL